MLFLPQEIVINILIRLPVKSLIRFQCVCKHWRNLIKTQSFISDHVHHSTLQTPSLLLIRNGLWILDCNMKLRQVDSDDTLLIDENTPRIIGSSNGLLCVKVDKRCGLRCNILLWNPAIRELRKLPPFPEGEISHTGFGFSPIIKDYKIVITYNSYHHHHRRYGVVSRVLVYSSISGSWKEVEYGMKNVGLTSKNAVTVNGAMFWFGQKQDTRTSYEVIVSFDIANEVFTLIPAPHTSKSSSGFTAYENKLAVLCSFSTKVLGSLIELWVMEDCRDASWAKKYESSLIPWVTHPMTIRMNQIVCQNDREDWIHRGNITLMNISTNELKVFDIRKCGYRHVPDDGIFDYVESLVPMGGNRLCTIFV